MKTLCLGCSRIVEPYRRGRCRECWRAVERKKSSTRKQPHLHNSEWRRLQRETIDRHIARYGMVCPRCLQRIASRRDLTVDHIKAGSLEAGVQVLCRSCNARKGNR